MSWQDSPLYEQFLKSQGLSRGIRMDQGEFERFRNQFQQYAQQQNAQTSAAPGLARTLSAMGMGPGTPQLDQKTGRYRTPMDPEAAAAVRLMSDPGTQGMGVQNANALLQPGADMARKTALQQFTNMGLQGQVAQQNLDQGAQAFPLEQQQRRGAIALQQSQLAAQQLAYQQAQLQAAAPKPVLPYGDPPKGYYPAMAPGGDVQYIPQRNTPTWNSAQEAVQSTERAIENLQGFLLSVDKAGSTGTEFFGGDANALRFERGNVVSSVAKARGLGVLQPAEYATIDQQLPDPTGMMRNMAAMASYLDASGTLPDVARDSILEPYQRYLKQMEEQLAKQKKQYWYVRHQTGLLPAEAK